MLDRYLTIKGYGETEIEINRSRFICYVERAETEEMAQSFIAGIKKKHWDATHNCSAYLIGETDHIQKADDDGEPSGTAGKPILEVLKKNHVKDCVVVVTRYFGGIKLGAGGLIRAYGKGASAALRAGQVVERVLHDRLSIRIDYTFLGKVENALRSQQEVILEEIAYTDAVTVHVLVPKGKDSTFVEWMTDLTSGQAVVTKGDNHYVEFPFGKELQEDEA
ncbi:YigZ family protein [Ammoniphilus resinae]|uniref:YigZ family protein n=1 Tax=Ammoniphilus resinae TaxID=861532 RepID=A0ABS4GX32_9BACL|nr:putative YigZ family protein [Ammoniphilus resinae]